MPEKNIASKKILVADDSLTIQKVIRLALSGDGYEIQTVSNGKEAIEQASLFRPDICIVDVSLPVFDAYQICEQFLAKPDLKNIPIILMSSAFEKVDESRVQSLGFAGHLIKPFDPSHLRSTLLAVANRTPQNDPVEATINAPLPLPPIAFDPPAFTTDEPGEDLPPLDQDYSFKETASSGMDDIQQMARNTFAMSGLDQHDWGMIEPGKAEAVTPETHGAFSNQNDNEVSAFDFQETSAMAGFSGQTPPPFSVSPDQIEEMVKAEVARMVEQLRDQVVQQIQDRLDREVNAFTRSEMPNLAEKMIKEEIHKLLSEPPL